MSDEATRELTHTESPSASAILERFDLANDAKIIEALSKRVTQGFTYKVNGKFGLSSAGVLWASREFAKQGEVYRVVGDLKIQPCPLDPECVNVWITVQRFFVHPGTGQEIALDSTIGHKRMSRKTKKYTDQNDDTKFEMVEDPEFTTKAITKAERNGKVKLMPKDAVTNLIAKASGQTMTPPPQKAPAKPANKPAGTAAPAQGAQQNAAPAADAAKPATTPAANAGAAKAANTGAGATSHTAQPAAGQPGPGAAAAAKEPAAQPTSGAPKMSKEIMVQKLDAVTKLLFGTQDGAVARQKLAAITGKASPMDLTEEEIKNVGNAVNAVVKKTAEIQGNNIVKISDKSILWKGPEAAPPATPTETPGEEAPMF